MKININRNLHTSIMLVSMFAFAACNNNSTMNNSNNSDSTKSDSNNKTLIPSANNFQTTIDGKQTSLYVLKNDAMQVAITNYGARVVSIIVPDKNGNPTDVSVGYDVCNPIQKEAIPILARSLVVMETALRKENLSWMAKNIHWQQTMAQTIYMAALKDFQEWCGIAAVRRFHAYTHLSFKGWRGRLSR